MWERLLDDVNATVGNSTDASVNGSGGEGSDSQILRNTFFSYGTALIIVSLVFCWVRRRFPKVFNLRSWVDDRRSELANTQYGFFSWFWSLYSIPDERYLDECGMDALCFVRICSMGLKLCIVGMFCAIFLMPLYATSPWTEETATVTDNIVKLTTGNLGPGSPRLIATAVAAYIVFGSSMYLILKEFEWFTTQRHRFMMKPVARNHAVFVRNIPDTYKSNKGLHYFFEKSLGGDAAVLETSIAVKTTNLQTLVARRDKTLHRLEHAIAEKEKHGKAPKHKVERKLAPRVSVPGFIGNAEEVDSIAYYSSELMAQNKDITERIDRLRMEAEQSLVIKPSTSSTDSSTLNGASDEEPGFLSFVKSSATNVVSGVKDGTTSITVGATDFIGKAAKEAMSLVVKADGDGEVYSAGFVVFKKLSTVEAAKQMIHDATPYSLEVVEAGSAEDIIWANVPRENKDLQLGRLLSMAASTLACFLWTIPVSFVASLSSVEGLRKQFSAINTLLIAAPALEPLFQLLAPQLLVALNAFLPALLEAVTKLEGPISGAMVEASLFVKLCAFMIIQTFFVSAISGGILQELSRLIENPTAIVDLLATSLPAQSTFFLQMSVVMTVTTATIEGLRIVPIVLAFIRRLVVGSEPKTNASVFGFLRPLSDPGDFPQADFLSNMVLFFMIFLVYAVIAPLVSFILALCFGVMGGLFRHQFIYIYNAEPDSGGSLWMNFIKILTSCLLVAEITITGLLALKKATVATPMMIPLCICTALFSVYIRQLHFRVAQHLPTRLCLKQDKKNENMDFSFLEDAYLQPELRNKEVFPDLSADRLAELGFYTNEYEDVEFNSHESTTISCRVTKLEVLPSLDEDEGESTPVDDTEGEV